MHRFVLDGEERIDYFFLITEWDGKPQNVEKHKCAQLLWVKQNDLPENTIPYIKEALGTNPKRENI